MGPVKIVRREETRLSPWVTLVRKDVQFSADSSPATYHAFKQADYVGIFAVTPSGRIPLIQQYRPAIERYTWELPGGMVDADEPPVECCRRELKEEIGLDAGQIHHLGSHPAEVGRLENSHHMFFVETGEPDPSFVPEPGTRVELVTRDELDARILSGLLNHPLHLALILLHDLKRPGAGGHRATP